MRRSNPFSSVRARLALWNVLILALVLAVLGGLLRANLKANLEASVDRDLARRASMAIGRWDFSWKPEDAARFARERQKQQAAQAARRAKDRQEKDKPPPGRDGFGPPFFDRNDKQVFTGATDRVMDKAALQRCWESRKPEYTTISSAGLARLPFDARLEGEPVGPPPILRVYTAPLIALDGHLEEVYQSARSLEPVSDEVDRLTGTLLALVPVGLLIAALGGMFLTDRAIRPVRTVTRAAAEIGAREDLSARLPVGGGDEFARLSATFNAMLGRLEEAFAHQEEAYEKQRRFVADASHELRTPLTVIKANTSLALIEGDLPTEYREVLEEVDTAADRTIRIVQDLLLLARSDAGEVPLEWEAVVVADLFEQARREAALLRGDAAALDVRPVEDGLRVFGDRHHLLRLLINLLDNSLRHTPADGKVTLSARPVGTDRVEFEVVDTGEGIPPEHLPHIMERFYRVEDSRERKQGGTGLGLAICQAIAHAHMGSLVISSEPGHGTHVHILLPRCR